MRLALALLLVGACDREIRKPLRGGDERPVSAAPNVSLFPADKPIEGGELDLSLPGYRETAQNISDGKKLYAMFNCVGCHANGGGAIGPALIDDRWIYGSTPDEVATTIIAGRPDGMPSYRGKLVPAQLYQLIAYVRSLGGLVRSDARSARSDHMQALPPPTLRDLAIPQPSKDRP